MYNFFYKKTGCKAGYYLLLCYYNTALIPTFYWIFSFNFLLEFLKFVVILRMKAINDWLLFYLQCSHLLSMLQYIYRCMNPLHQYKCLLHHKAMIHIRQYLKKTRRDGLIISYHCPDLSILTACMYFLPYRWFKIFILPAIPQNEWCINDKIFYEHGKRSCPFHPTPTWLCNFNLWYL